MKHVVIPLGILVGAYLGSLASLAINGAYDRWQYASYSARLDVGRATDNTAFGYCVVAP